MAWQSYDRRNPTGAQTQSCPIVTPDSSGFCEPTFQLCEGYCECNCNHEDFDYTCGLSEDEAFCQTCKKSKACIDLRLTDDDDLSFDGGILSHVLVTLAVKGRHVEGPDDSDTWTCADQSCHDCNDDGGWWYDAFRDKVIGSRLWKLEGRLPYATSNEQTRLEAEQIIREDLQFLIDWGAVDRIEIDSEINDCGELCVRYIDLYPPKGGVTRAEIKCLWPASTTA